MWERSGLSFRDDNSVFTKNPVFRWFVVLGGGGAAPCRRVAVGVFPVGGDPACRGGGDGAAVLDLLSGGRCVFTAVRTPDGWRLSRVVVRETWRRPTGGRPDGVID